MDDDEEIQSRTPSPASSPMNGRISVPVVPPPDSPAPEPLGIPPQPPRASNGGSGGGGGGGGREDCWSELATEVLIDAWGERYVESIRGNLKQKEWQEVADLVNSRGGYSKVPKSDVQCKNRIDTVKKKYKSEKAKIAGGRGVSNWPLFDKLDGLIGPLGKSPLPSANKTVGGSGLSGKTKNKRKRKVESEDDDGDEEEEAELGFDSDDGLPPPRKVLPGVDRKDVGNVEKGGRDRSVVRVLTETMLKFGEVYEKAESAKLAQLMEMEKARMRFAKEVELQRMQFFMKTQMEISQLKKHSSRGGAGGVMGSKHKQQRRYHFHHHHRERPDGNNVAVDKNASDNE